MGGLETRLARRMFATPWYPKRKGGNPHFDKGPSCNVSSREHAPLAHETTIIEPSD